MNAFIQQHSTIAQNAKHFAPKPKGAAAILTTVLTAVFALCLCWGVNAFNSSSSAYADQTGSLTIHASTAPAGADSASSILPGDTTPISGVSYTVTLINSDPAAANSYETNGDSANNHIDDLTDVSLNASSQTLTTDASGKVSFTGLALGLYKVEVSAPISYTPAQKVFLVAIPMAAENNASNYAVEIWPKLTTQKLLTKQVEEAPAVAGVGSLTTWKVTNIIPDGLVITNPQGQKQYAKNWYIFDEVDPALTYNGATLELTDSKGSVLATFVEGIDYTQTQTPTENYTEVRWTMTAVGTQKAADLGAYALVAHITTTINEKAYGLAGSIFNNAGVVFKNAAGDPFEQKVIPDASKPDPNNSEHPHLTLGSLTIDKRLTGTETRLSGAHFKVATSQENAKANTFLQKEGADIELITDDEGKATLSGLKAGTYYVVETQAPKASVGGTEYTCVLTDTPVALEVLNDASKASVTATIDNPLPKGAAQSTDGKSGAEGVLDALAKTGDMLGPLAFVLIAAAIAALVVVLVARRKRDKEE